LITSDSLTEFAPAFAAAQAKIEGARKSVANTFFKSTYADLADVWDEIREPLTENGLSVVQSSDAHEAGIVVTTLLLHKSGQWVRTYTPAMQPKDHGPQAIGSCITYGRRYGLAAAVGCPQIDDDGNTASGRKSDYHDPKGDVGKDVPPKEANAAADQLREALAANNPTKAKAVSADLNKNQDLYMAAWRLLHSKERSTFKKLLDAADEVTQ